MAVQEFLGSIGASIVDPLLSIWCWLVKAVPDIIAALVILIVGYLIALVVEYVIENVLKRINFDDWVFHKTNIASAVGKFDLTHFLGLVAKWYVLVLFLGATANRIQLATLAGFLSDLAMWIPQVILAVVMALIGIGAGMYVEKKVGETRARASKIVGMAAKWVIYVFTALIVLDQIGVQIALAQQSFLIILTGAVATIALVLGISFGFGFKDEARKIISDVKRKL